MQYSIPKVWQVVLPNIPVQCGIVQADVMASLTVLAILWPSLPIILKFSTDVVWPVLFWCSYIGDGAFRCSLHLSPKVLDDSPIYSSSQSILFCKNSKGGHVHQSEQSHIEQEHWGSTTCHIFGMEYCIPFQS